MTLWYITNTIPKRPRNRKRRQWRVVIMAETMEDAMNFYRASTAEIGELKCSEWGGNQVDLRGILVP